jgi:hypothetical protein
MPGNDLTPSPRPDLNDPIIVKMVADVRESLRDYPELNRLTHGFDHSDRHIFWAILDTLGDWVSTPPFIGITLTSIVEKGWWSIFRRGVIIALLESLGILHMRNFLAYSDGGMNVQTEDPRMIQAWLSAAKNEYEQKKTRALIAANLSDALELPGIHSEYLFVNSFWGSW